MANPTINAVGVGAASDAGITVTLPTHAANDILLLLVETNSGEVPATPSGGWAVTADSPQDNAGENSRLSAFWLRAASSSETNPAFADVGDHIFGAAISISGCITTGDPWNVTSGSTHTFGAGISITGDTTTVDECLVVVCVGSGRNASSGATFSNWANADLTSVGEIFDATNTAGGGGGFGIATGIKAVAGAFGATTVDIVGVGGGHITFAFRPPAAAGASRPTGDGNMAPGLRMGFNPPPNLVRR